MMRKVAPAEQQQAVYLTVNECCELAKVSRPTFYKWLNDRESGLASIAHRLPVIHNWRVPRHLFMAWMEGRLPKP